MSQRTERSERLVVSDHNGNESLVLSQPSASLMAEDFYRPRTEADAAMWLGITAATLQTWRRETRRVGRRIGPAWINLSAAGKKQIPRYRLIDIIAWQEERRVALEPARRPGRPRKRGVA